ncbi:MAG: IS256 family transposase, partial [Methanotrichaceae archaeon]|nr:IS256 family transposase [Methanotrichaceae archaeon]
DRIFDGCRGTVKTLLEQAMRPECDMHIGFIPYERGVGKPDSRNGYYERDLESVFGLLENLRVPRTRKGTFRTALFERYKRRQKRVEMLIREMFVRGVSTRKVGEVLKPLLGIEPSSSTVSSIAKTLDAEVKKYKSRPIKDEFKYLILDGVTMKVKEAPHARSISVLCAYGITTYGRRELIAFDGARAESEACCEAFLESLWRRGLQGEKLDLIITDGSPGLIRGVELVYPGVRRQRCWAHKDRNIASKVRRKNQEECLLGARKIYHQKSRRAAIEAYRQWEERWKDEEPAAVECLARDLEEMLSFYSMPEHHWKKIRTTNLIERIFREVRRRTRPMTCFANRASCDRIIFAVFDGFNKRWESHPIRHFTQKT